MSNGKESKFPVGAAIVREKLFSDLTPDKLSVMIKREKGFNPEVGDWEFLMIDAATRVIKPREQYDCAYCHSSKKSDFVFRSYQD